MKTMIVAAVAALSLGMGMGAAYAQGGPVGYGAPVYGSQAFSDHSRDAQVQFLGRGTVLGKVFNHAESDRVAAASTPAKGS